MTIKLRKTERVAIKLRANRDKLIKEIGKVCVEMQYYKYTGDKRAELRIPYLQHRLGVMLKESLKITLLINEYERTKHTN